jgi:type IX secretion system substrate protein
MKTEVPLLKRYILVLACALNSVLLFAGSPGLIWHQAYGDPTLTQQLTAMVIDNYDNVFAAGFVNFGTNGNIIINRYDGVGNMMWNRLYNNSQTSTAIDKPVALFPDNQAGITCVGYANGPAILTHILHYDPTGTLTGDVAIGDTSAGSKTYPLVVLYDGASSYYMIGQLNNVSKIFRCDNLGNVTWSVPLHNNYNNHVGSINFDNYGSVVAGVFDSATAQVIIHRYDMATGNELPGFNTHIDSLPVNDNFIKILVDQSSNTFVAATGFDSAGRTQLVVDKFDTTGALIAKTVCNSTKGHCNTVNSFLFDNLGDVIISGPFSDDTDSWQFGALYKVANAGGVIWTAIDSQFLVNSACAQVDLFDNIYLGTTKTPSGISPYYSDFSFTQLSPDSGLAQWNRSFDNTANNTGLIMQVNNFGDLFLATNTTTDTGSTWFLARVGNAANDSLGTGVTAIHEATNELVVFPNPFSSVTNIGFTAKQDGEQALKIFDITGRLLQQQSVKATAGYNQVTVQTLLSSGVYLLKLEDNNDSAIKQVIVY